MFEFNRIDGDEINLYKYKVNEFIDSYIGDNLAKDDTIIYEPSLNFKCNLPKLIYNNSMALKYLHENRISLKKTFDSCKLKNFYEIYEISDYLVMNDTSFKKNLPGNYSIYYKIKLKKYEFNQKFNLKNLTNVKCTLNRFDKLINVSETQSKLEKYETFEFKQEFDYELYLPKHGFYSISCILSGLVMNTKIYEDVISILPRNMKVLTDERKKYIPYETKFKTLINGTNDSINLTNEKIQNKFSKKMNVLLLGFDSISKNHFKRIFPLTYSYLKSELAGNVLLENFNSVGGKYVD